MCPATLTVSHNDACCYVAILSTIHCIYILDGVVYSLYLHHVTSAYWYLFLCDVSIAAGSHVVLYHPILLSVLQ